jgi:HSP20 family protein
MIKTNAALQNQVSIPVSHKREPGNLNHWVPNTDMYVTNDLLVIKVELSGMRREDLELSIENNRLFISGQRPDGCRKAKCKFLIMEINYGSFECVIEIPPGYNLTKAQAAYHNGFLRIEVPPADLKAPPSTSKHPKA